jgi:exodeoxyribonuclease VII large subunit
MTTWTVGRLTQEIKGLLAEELGQVAVEGEISKLVFARSGHWYFNLVDADASLNAVIFRGTNSRMNWEPQEGDKVLAVGSIDVYAPMGKYSLIVRRMEPSGEGARARALEQLKARLKEEGLFDDSRKVSPPWLPRAIGVVTSPTGAALQDIINVLGRRFPAIPIYLAPCRVQGDQAAGEIAGAIRLLNDHGIADLLIVGRGGGSVEDLWAFNEEEVVRAISESAIPIISAVGHETDTSLSDLVADVRAPTPSAAAELAVPEYASLVFTLEQLFERLTVATVREIGAKRENIKGLRLIHPGARLREQRKTLLSVQARLHSSGRASIERSSSTLAVTLGKLEALSPLAVLARGFSITTLDGRVVKSAGKLASGDVVQIKLSDGEVSAKVLPV